MAITDQVIQLPGDSTGKKLDTSELTVGANTVNRERVNITSPESTGASAIAPVSSSGGLSVTVTNPSTSVTVTNISTAVSLSSAIALSSGIVTLSSVPTVTATAATNPWSSAPGFNVPIVSASSGLIGLSSTPFFNLVGSSSAPAVVTSSGGLEVTIVSGAGAGSTAVNIVGSSGGIAPATTSGGLSVTIVAGAGAGSTEVHLVGTGNEIAPVTTSAGLVVNISSGLVTFSSVPTVTATGPTTITSGLVSITSGTITLSSVHTVTATAATNPWSSAPGFNVPIVSVSSGLVQISGTASVASASSGHVGTFASTSRTYDVFTFNSSSSNSVTIVTTLPAILYGWNMGNQTTSGATSVKIYNTSSGAVGSTAQLQVNVPLPGGSAGGGNNLIIPQGVPCTGGITFAITANFAATSTGAVAAGDVVGTLYYNT